LIVRVRLKLTLGKFLQLNFTVFVVARISLNFVSDYPLHTQRIFPVNFRRVEIDTSNLVFGTLIFSVQKPRRLWELLFLEYIFAVSFVD
jgi:hypothetical protein